MQLSNKMCVFHANTIRRVGKAISDERILARKIKAKIDWFHYRMKFFINWYTHEESEFNESVKLF